MNPYEMGHPIALAMNFVTNIAEGYYWRQTELIFYLIYFSIHNFLKYKLDP